MFVVHMNVYNTRCITPFVKCNSTDALSSVVKNLQKTNFPLKISLCLLMDNTPTFIIIKRRYYCALGVIGQKMYIKSEL